MKEKSLTVELTEIDPKNREVGSKAANLGKLIQSSFTVPNGFVIRSNAYITFLKSNKIIEFIHKSLESIDYNNLDSIERLRSDCLLRTLAR